MIRKGAFMHNWLKLEPVFKEMIWGGQRLKENFNYDIPSNQTGEAWVVSAHPEGSSMIVDGQFQDMTLDSCFKEHRDIFGPGNNTTFPLMIKIIDANKDLSIQVHPDDEYGLKHSNSLGKYESWYILDADPDTQLEIGHHAQTVEEFATMLRNKQYDQLLRYIPIKKGDCFNVVPGTVHALCAGTLVYEVQQNSNVTYRIYDYDRVDLNGNLRELHIKDSLNVITAPSYPQNNNLSKDDTEAITKLIDNKYFTLHQAVVSSPTRFEFNQVFITCTIIEGSGTINGHSIHKGDNFVVLPKEKKLDMSGQFKALIAQPKVENMQ
jgi:mannose-6-phosphate isomerase